MDKHNTIKTATDSDLSMSAGSVRVVWIAQGQHKFGDWHDLPDEQGRRELKTLEDAKRIAMEYSKYESIGWAAYRVVERSDKVEITFPPQNNEPSR